MSKNHPAHEKADYISKHVPEIAAIYQTLGMRSYFDGKYSAFGLTRPVDYDQDRPIQDEIQTKKDQIDEILWKITYNQIENELDGRGFKEGAAELAQRYVHLPWLHTPWLTSKILTQLLDSELLPLKDEAFGANISDFFSAILPDGSRAVLREVLSLTYPVALLVITVALLSFHYLILGLLVLAYMLWHLGQKVILSCNSSGGLVDFAGQIARNRLTYGG